MDMTTERNVSDTAAQHASSDAHRLRSERIAARGVRLGKGRLRYLIPLVGLAVLASVAFAQV